jgi:RHS repeat-associated protein
VAYYTTAASGSAGAHFEHQDWLGTERLRTTYNGGVEGSFTSLPWGDNQTPVANGSDANHYAQLDHDSETNTDHAQFRQYSNTQGRFLSPDPYSGSYDMGNPQSMNRYVYAMNSPLGNIDPSGLEVCYLDEISMPCSIAGGVADSGGASVIGGYSAGDGGFGVNGGNPINVNGRFAFPKLLPNGILAISIPSSSGVMVNPDYNPNLPDGDGNNPYIIYIIAGWKFINVNSTISFTSGFRLATSFSSDGQTGVGGGGGNGGGGGGGTKNGKQNPCGTSCHSPVIPPGYKSPPSKDPLCPYIGDIGWAAGGLMGPWMPFEPGLFGWIFGLELGAYDHFNCHQ